MKRERRQSMKKDGDAQWKILLIFYSSNKIRKKQNEYLNHLGFDLKTIEIS